MNLAFAEPTRAQQHLQACRDHRARAEFDDQLRAAEAVLAAEPGHSQALQAQAEALICCGRIDQARTVLSRLETQAQHDAMGLQHIAQQYVHAAAHGDALRCHERALALAPEVSGFRFNLATSCIAVGDLARAQTLLDEVVARDPGDFGAWHQRSMLTRSTARDHRIDALQALRDGLPSDHPGHVPLCYALGKEFEDLGEDAASFDHFQQGASARRRRLGYQVQTDVDAMAQIARVFDGRLLSRAVPGVAPGPRPWFVLGLPRSGTTLVERFLTAHSALASLGEIEGLTFALLRLAGGTGQDGKGGLIERSARIDFQRLSALYRSTIASYRVDAGGLLNKLPQNTLYLGLIHLSLADAVIVHVRRHPLDSCYAMLKTLFRMGYPYSYSLADLGHYYLAYHRLMAHWRSNLPGRMVEVDYERLVADPEPQVRQVLQHAGLPWEEACLDFHSQRAPSNTASAVQVRQPLYQTSAGRWRQHAQGLAPLADFLQAHGIDCS